METERLVLDVGLALGLAAATGWLARRIGLPSVVGYLVAGLLISPFTPGYVADRQQIALFADVGVVLLLFEVGIEIDLAALGRDQRALVWAAPLQVAITLGATAGVLTVTGMAPFGALILGLSIALSSSVVIVNITRSSRRTTDEATERAMLGWSVVQDVTGVGVAAVLLAVFEANGRPLPLALASLGLYALLAAVAALALPIVLRHLHADHDLLLLVSVASGLVAASVGAVVFGVPMALAAFVAGLVITEGPETTEVRHRLQPFRDVFACLFFVSLGSLIDPAAMPAALPYAALFVALVIGAKSAPAYALARMARLPARPLQLGVGIAQIGEFSFVLGSIGLAAGALAPVEFSGLLLAVVTTIAGSAVLVRVVGRRPAAP